LSPYRFFYRVVDDTVWIVAVWHARQLPQEPDDVARG
jgi:toxin ParE1/3/4